MVMGVGSAAGRAIGFLGKHFVRFGRLNPLLTAGLTGVAIGGAVYKHKRDEKIINEKIEEAFRDEKREQDLWNTVRSQIAGASEDLYKTYTVYREDDEKPSFYKGHAYRPRKGERIGSVRQPDVGEACDLVSRGIESLLQSNVGGISSLINRGMDPARGLAAELKKVQARLERARDGKVKRPDYAGMQKQIDRCVEETIKPVLSDLSYVIGQGAARIREESRKGFFRNRAA